MSVSNLEEWKWLSEDEKTFCYDKNVKKIQKEKEKKRWKKQEKMHLEQLQQ